MTCPHCGAERSLEIIRRLLTETEVYCNVCGKTATVPTHPPRPDPKED